MLNIGRQGLGGGAAETLIGSHALPPFFRFRSCSNRGNTKSRSHNPPMGTTTRAIASIILKAFGKAPRRPSMAHNITCQCHWDDVSLARVEIKLGPLMMAVAVGRSKGGNHSAARRFRT
jgi:hypothetical protein